MIVERSPRHAYVFVASYTGCARLSGEIGLPLVHVDVAWDVAHAVRRLNVVEHASGALYATDQARSRTSSNRTNHDHGRSAGRCRAPAR